MQKCVGDMMARVVSSMAELAGKVGGTIWQRTRAGVVVKSYTRPVDPYTAPQARHRALIGQASRAYSMLSDETRARWQAFASVDGLYVPLSGINKGQYTGQQAFISLRSALASLADAMQRLVTCKIGGADVNPLTPPAPLIEPPSFRLDGRINCLPAPYPVLLSNVVWTSPQQLTVTLDLVGSRFVSGAQIPPGPIRDGTVGGSPIYIAACLYASPILGSGAQVAGSFSAMRAVPLWPFAILAAPVILGSGSVDVEVEITTREIGQKYGWRIGQRYQWTLVLTDTAGNQCVAGSVISPLQA